MYIMQPDELFIDTSTAAQQYMPYAVGSPVSMDYAELPQPSIPSFHPRYPLPPSNTRSYTLEGAITPVTPPSHVPLPTPPPAHAQRTFSPPPMGALLPPSQPAEASQPSTSTASSPPHVKLEPESSSVPPAAPAVQKRPRGRPRKNPPTAQPPSPAPAVDYPYPHFPDSASCSAPRPEDANMPPMSHPLTLAGGTPGSVGPMPGASGKTTATETANLPAGQAIFRLNMHKDGEEGAEGRETEKKKPIMACLFCRERKIACGPPAPGGPRRCK